MLDILLLHSLGVDGSVCDLAELAWRFGGVISSPLRGKR